MTQDMYAGSSETTEGKVFTVSGQDWDSIVSGLAEDSDNKVVVNMGPQHPSTHGVLRLILELDGETVTCLLYTSPSPRDGLLSRMPSSA